MQTRLKQILLLLFPLLIFSCKTEKNSGNEARLQGEALAVDYAKGFTIEEFNGFKILTVENPWPEAENSYKYLLVEDEAEVPQNLEFNHKISIPVEKIVVTSTTHIPSLEALNKENTLIGFPDLHYISSERTRKLIENGRVTEIGRNEAINTEVLISLQPDVVIGFAVNSNNSTYNSIEKSGIPVLFNGDWTEEHPLGKAEWLKFFGALFNQSEKAADLFERVETEYLEAKELARTTEDIPTVISGSMYKDQWFVPYGNSWSAIFIEDANADYIYKNTKGSGSISLAFETVLNDAQDADFWISPGQFKTVSQLNESSAHYNQFKSVKNGKVFTYSNTIGETGGVLYYELAPNRPDLVLKDLISIFHPELLPNYEATFFKPLE